MALSHDETIELTNVYQLMTAEELRGQLGEDDDHDALINNILGDGKAVELENGPAPTLDADDLPTDDGQDDEEEDEDEEDDDLPPEVLAAPAVAEVPAVEAPAAVAEVPAADIPPLDQSYLAEKFDAKLTELDTVNAQNLAKLMSGEMEAEEYAKAQAQYLRDRDALKDQKTIEADWGKTVHGFQTQAAKESGINYFTDTEKAESLDGWVKHLANNPKHADKPGDWFLKEAHKKVLVEYGITAAKAAEPVADAKKVAPKTARTPKLDNIPPTLSGLPAAAPAASGDGGEFDHLANLSGYKFEQAIARMSPDQRARYEAE